MTIGAGCVPPPPQVELDAGHEDLAEVEPVPEHARRHQAAARDREHQVVVAPDRLGELADQPIQLGPGHVERPSVQGEPREKETPLGDEPEGRLARAIW